MLSTQNVGEGLLRQIQDRVVGRRPKRPKNMASVKEIYYELLKAGNPPKEAAKMAQERTGMSLVTGAPIRKDIPYKKAYKSDYKGQYGG